MSHIYKIEMQALLGEHHTKEQFHLEYKEKKNSSGNPPQTQRTVQELNPQEILEGWKIILLTGILSNLHKESEEILAKTGKLKDCH